MSLSQRFNIFVALPTQVTIDSVCAAIKTEGTTVVSFNFREISSKDVDKLASALTDLAVAKSLVKLELIGAFALKGEDRSSDQIKIFDAVKYRLKQLVLDQNVLSKNFLHYVDQQKKSDERMTIEISCDNCSDPYNASSGESKMDCQQTEEQSSQIDTPRYN